MTKDESINLTHNTYTSTIMCLNDTFINEQSDI